MPRIINPHMNLTAFDLFSLNKILIKFEKKSYGKTYT